MRIAFVFSKYPPLQDGGADYLEHLAAEMASLGHEVAVFTSSDPRIKLAYPDGEHRGYHVYPLVDDWRMPIFSRSSWSQFCKAMKKFSPHIIYVVFPDSVMLSNYQIPFAIPFAFNVPVVTLLFSLFLKSANLIGKLGFLGLLIGSRKLIVHTGYLKEELERYAFGWRDKVKLVPIGNNLASVSVQGSAESARLRLGIPEDVVLLGYYGDIDPSKGVDVILEALRILNDQNYNMYLVFIGGRSEENRFWRQTRDQIRDLNLENWVRMTGYIEREEVPTYLLSCTMCVLPFRKNVLGRSSLISALSLGIPTITSESPSDSKYLQHGSNVYMIPRNSSQALATAVIEIAQSSSLRNHLSQNALHSAKHFHWSAVAQQTEAIFNSLLIQS